MTMFVQTVARLLLICFISFCIMPPQPVQADGSGSVRIFSEVKGIEVYVDENFQGIDTIEIRDLEQGQHYVKAVLNGTVIYSELINVNPDASTAILIKSSGAVKSKILESQYKEQQEYKNRKVDILLSKSFQTVGSSQTYSDYFPGYYSIFGMGWTKSSSTTYETTDWKIIQGGVQEISDLEFARLVNDTETLSAHAKRSKDYEDSSLVGAIVALTGIVAAAVGLSTALNAKPGTDVDGPALTFSFGVLGTIIGIGILSNTPPTGHMVSPSKAARQAYEYNQNLKSQLGLPESYEP